MRIILFLMFVLTCTFCFFLHALWGGTYSPVDVLGLVASTSGLTCLVCEIGDSE